jgi:hypothetical protein
MSPRKKQHFTVRTPKIEELGRGVKVPELPKSFRKKLWNVVKVRTEIKLSEETEHFMNILCLHFGISRNDLVLHAINLLWQEVADGVGLEQLKNYEDKLEAVRLYRLEKKESDVDRKKNNKLKFYAQNDRRGYARTDEVGTIWRYNSKKPVRDYKVKRKVATVMFEAEEDVGKE